MMNRRQTLFATVAAMGMGMGMAVPAMAGPDTSAALNTDENGVMLKGHDPVAYFTEGAPVKGSAEFTATHEGATYHFASVENRDMFTAEPAKFAPAFGGYCAMGAAMGMKLDTKPELFEIVDGTLYVNSAEGAHKRWLTDTSGFIEKANANWAEIREVPAEKLNGD